MKGAIIGAPPVVKYLRKDQLGQPNGVAPLDEEGKLYTDNLPDALAELVEGGGSVAEHTHDAGDINSGIFGVPRGGTGLATLTKDSFLVGNGANAVQLLTAAQALSKIGAAASSHEHSGADITSGLDTLADSLSGYLSGAKIQTGSYTGTGTYGSSNPCSLTFRKPHRRIFELALEMAGLPPEDVWYAGDNYACDVMGARNAGLFPVWYVGASHAPSQPEGDVLTISHWDRLKSILAEGPHEREHI